MIHHDKQKMYLFLDHGKSNIAFLRKLNKKGDIQKIRGRRTVSISNVCTYDKAGTGIKVFFIVILEPVTEQLSGQNVNEHPVYFKKLLLQV